MPRSTQAACDLARQLGVDHLEMRNRRRQHPDWPCKDLYVTFRKAIDPDSEKNMLAIPRKQRAMVRKGIKEELRAEIDDGVDRHYDMYSESLRNLGTPVVLAALPRDPEGGVRRGLRHRHDPARATASSPAC